MLIDTIGRVGTIANSADSAYYTVIKLESYMIFVFVEDGTLEVVESLEDAQKYEGIDVESDVFIFYDEKGVYLKPIFTTPNKVKSIFGLFKTVESGEYILVPEQNDTDSDSIDIMLAETVALEQNKWFQSLDEVRRFITSHSSAPLRGRTR